MSQSSSQRHLHQQFSTQFIGAIEIIRIKVKFYNILMRLIIFTLLCLTTLGYIILPFQGVESVANCYITLENGECEECSFGYMLDDGECVPGMQNCKTYSPEEGVCTSCYVGYKLTKSKDCEVDPQADTLIGCSASSQGKCMECQHGFYANYDGNCQPIDPLCLNFNPRTRHCLFCEIGYVYRPNRGQCLPGSTNWDSGCVAYIGHNMECRNCLNNLYLHGQCLNVNTNCRQVDPKDPSKCISCFQDMVVSEGYCVSVNQNKLCASFAPDGSCNKCKFKTVKNGAGICTPVDQKCQTYNNYGHCLSCYSGYTLLNSTCVLPQQLEADPLCQYWVNGKCSRCAVWSFPDQNGKCKAASPLCRSYRMDNGNCNFCYGGWQLKRGTCVPSVNSTCLKHSEDGKCLACISGYQYDETLGFCEVDYQLCAKKDKTGACVLCYNNYYVKDGKCEEIDPKCGYFDNKINKCTRCYMGWTLKDNKCYKNPDN